jgi:hypothetical protein
MADERLNPNTRYYLVSSQRNMLNESKWSIVVFGPYHIQPRANSAFKIYNLILFLIPLKATTAAQNAEPHILSPELYGRAPWWLLLARALTPKSA